MTADPTIQLPDHSTEGRLWAAVLDVADAHPTGWTLIGALMVMLHAHDHGLDARRTTRDADALVDVRGIAQPRAASSRPSSISGGSCTRTIPRRTTSGSGSPRTDCSSTCWLPMGSVSAQTSPLCRHSRPCR